MAAPIRAGANGAQQQRLSPTERDEEEEDEEGGETLPSPKQ